jgi:hypothetical protein
MIGFLTFRRIGRGDGAFEWARDHPDDFSLGGDVLDMLRDRAAYRLGL